MSQPARTLSLLMVFVFAIALGAQQPPSDLRIVVIEGEDAVNIIQQETAVAPVVEVRDRNNLPVAGVPVTFALTGTGSTFAGGTQTITIVTNAAGRAAATTISPAGSGAFKIAVTATHQGQTATLAIAQTNFATAQAAQAARTAGQAAQSGSSAGSTGGGLSGKMIAGIAAAGAGAAAVVATQVGGNDGPAVGEVSASPQSTIVGMDIPITFNVTASDPDNDALTYRWEFGDGNTSTTAAPSHIYRTAGSYTVRVTVNDGDKEASGQTTVTLRNLSGTWRAASSIETSSVGAVTPVFTFTQSGSSATATQSFTQGARGTLGMCDYVGSLQATSPRISLITGTTCGGFVNGANVTFGASPLVLDPGSNADTLVGTWAVRYPITLTRQ